MLRTSSTAVVDDSGNPVTLTGVNAGSFLCWEGWVLGAGWDSETVLMDRLTKSVGAADATKFRAQMRDNFITPLDWQKMKSMGYNVARVPFNHSLLENDSQPGVYTAGGWARLDRVVSEAEAAGMLLVLDMHAVPGSQSMGFTADYTTWPLVWGNKSLEDRTIKMWRAIAERYSSSAAIAGYDLINEPYDTYDNWSGVRVASLYQRIIAAIREVDKQHMIIVEGNNVSHDFRALAKWDSNMMFSFHQYPSDQGSPDAQLQNWSDKALANDVPLWCGEYGATTQADARSQRERFAKYPVVGHTYWSWKLADYNYFYGFAMFTGAAPAKFQTTPRWRKMCDYLRGGSAMPTPFEARLGMNEFLDAIRIERCAVFPV